MLNILEIKALLPGSGKTTTLVELFKRSNLDNKIILTPSNKARQVCIQKLGLPYEEASKYVKTLKSFKRNYVSVLLKEDDDSDMYVTTESKDRITLKPYNIFVDEASMISNWEMQDLIKHFRIQNLILDGDSLQFDPIGCKQAILDSDSNVVRNSEGNLLFTEDTGEAYKLPITHQVLLNKQMRAQDEALQTAIDLIKEGKLATAIAYIVASHRPIECENKDTDLHIAYTNAKCDKLNKMYKSPKKWIVAKDDKMHSFFTSEIIEEPDRRFVSLDQYLTNESILNSEKGKKIPSFSEWKVRHLKPAYAITCHKLQGSTMAKEDIFIHLDDILLGLQDVMDVKERAKLFQRFLYVAVSRAVSIDQVNIYGCNKEDLLSMQKRVNATQQWDSYTEFCNEVIEELEKMDELAEEMVDETIKPDAVQFAADDEKLLDYLESCLNFEVEEDELYLKWKKEHYNEEFSKAQKGKHSKPHKPHNYDPQMIEDVKSMRCNEWKRKWRKSDTLYRKLKSQ